MKRIAVLLSAFLLLAGCSGCLADDALRKEAENAATQEFGKFVIKCGDDFYDHIGRDGSYMFSQYKKALISIEETTSEADRLNGLVWVGEARLTFYGVYRHYLGGQWTEWREVKDRTFNSEVDYTIIIAYVRKIKNGQWETAINTIQAMNLNPFTCSDIPKEPNSNTDNPKKESDFWK